jgi:hypothetical protein
MSSTLTSPFVSALPANNVFTQYDSDGDVIMTDAVTGLPITYGTKRGRSDSDSASGSDSDEAADGGGGSGRLSPIKTPRAPVGIPTTACPPAPKKEVPPLPPSPPSPVAVAAEEGEISPIRNLAEAMAEAVLEGEPRDSPIPPPGGEAAPAAPQDWCLAVNCDDLALRLDMRHPRVVLNFLRFVDSYNEIAPEGEKIRLPYMDRDTVQMILSHESVLNVVPEFAADVAELRERVYHYSCKCPDCDPDNWSDSRDDEEDRYSRDSRY